MGLNNAFMSLGRIVGPLWAGFAFDINLSFPYLTGGLIMLVGFIASIFWLRETHHVAPDAPLPAPSSK
jgi:DHA1 family multidrug resistance protein-like MFS transporter